MIFAQGMIQWLGEISGRSSKRKFGQWKKYIGVLMNIYQGE